MPMQKTATLRYYLNGFDGQHIIIYVTVNSNGGNLLKQAIEEKLRETGILKRGGVTVFWKDEYSSLMLDDGTHNPCLMLQKWNLCALPTSKFKQIFSDDDQTDGEESEQKTAEKAKHLVNEQEKKKMMTTTTAAILEIDENGNCKDIEMMAAETDRNANGNNTMKITNVSTQTNANPKANVFSEGATRPLSSDYYNAFDFVVHNGVHCDNCMMRPIIGYRYKCLVCHDYDLCQNCEMKHFHPEHLMIRMPNANCRPLVNNLRQRYNNIILEMPNAEAIGLGAAVNPMPSKNTLNNHQQKDGDSRAAGVTESKGGGHKIHLPKVRKGSSSGGSGGAGGSEQHHHHHHHRHHLNRKSSKRCRSSHGIWGQLFDAIQTFGEDGLNAARSPSCASSTADEAVPAKEKEKENVASKPTTEAAESVGEGAPPERDTKCSSPSPSQKPMVNHHDPLVVAQKALSVAVNQLYSATKAAGMATMFMNESFGDGDGNGDGFIPFFLNQRENSTPSVSQSNDPTETSANSAGNDKNDEASAASDLNGNTVTAADTVASVYKAFCNVMKVSSKMSLVAANFLESMGGEGAATMTSAAAASSSSNNAADQHAEMNNGAGTEASNANEADQSPKDDPPPVRSTDSENVNVAAVANTSATLMSSEEEENKKQQQQQQQKELELLKRTVEEEEQFSMANSVTIENCHDDDDDIEYLTHSSPSSSKHSDVDSVSESFIKLDIVEPNEASKPTAPRKAEDGKSTSGVDDSRSSSVGSSGLWQGLAATENRRYESTHFYHQNECINNAVAAMIRMGFSNENNYLVQLLERVDGSISHALDLLDASQH